jgi:hypothetical protein
LDRTHALRIGFVGTLVVALMMAMVGAYAMLDATTHTSSTTGQFSPVKPPPPAPGEVVVPSSAGETKTEPSTDRSEPDASVASGDRSSDGGSSSSGHSRVRGNDLNQPAQVPVVDEGTTDESGDGSTDMTGDESSSDGSDASADDSSSDSGSDSGSSSDDD